MSPALDNFCVVYELRGGLGAVMASETTVFISYSRKDGPVVDRLVAMLRNADFSVLRDVDDILPAEPWRNRLRQMIEEAHVVAYFLSPASVASPECRLEIQIAEELKKKIVPIAITDTTEEPPGKVATLNYIQMHLIADDAAAAAIMSKALTTDIQWLREHARIGLRARRWEERSKPTAELLRGAELLEARAWLANQKAAHEDVGVTPIHRAFVDASERQYEFERDFTQKSLLRREIIYLIAGLASCWLLFRAARTYFDF